MAVLSLERARQADAQGDRIALLWTLFLPLALLVFLSLASRIDPDWYDRAINNEQGFLELAQAAVVGAAFLVALSTLPAAARARPRWLLAWAGLATVCCLYVTGEEVSWGQHLFGWTTPEDWKEINDQDETNLHNVSAWFDQKPRWLLGLAVGFGGLGVPLLALRWPEVRQSRLGPILPPFSTLPVAAIAVGVGAIWTYDDFVSRTGIFGRPSEVQELYFYYFVLLYLIVLRRRFRASTES